MEQVRIWLIKIRDMAVNGLVITVVLIVTILLVAIVGEPYFDNPPITISNQNEKDLGVLCSGESYMIVNDVTVTGEVIVTYYISVLDELGVGSILGTQEIHPGFQHPFAGSFKQEFPWTVPPLPPGKYTRSFGARGTDTEEKSVFVTHTFTIGSKERCGNERR